MKPYLKRWLGWLLCRLLPTRAQLLRSEFTLPYWHSEIRNTRVDTLMRHHIAREASKDPTGKELEALHMSFWARHSHDGWYAGTSERFEGTFRPLVEGYADLLQRLLTELEIDTVCEIGAGRGECLDFLRRRLSGPTRFIGLDLSDSQIGDNRQKLPDLEFISADAREWVAANPTGNTLYYCVGGVFEYFSRVSLVQLATQISRSSHCCLIMPMFEPVAEQHDLDTDPRSHIHGSEHSFSHNYVAVFEAAGLRVVHVDERPSLKVRTITICVANRTFGEDLAGTADHADSGKPGPE